MFPRARTPDGEIEGAGGAYVRRRLPFGDRVLVNGDRLTAEEVATIPDMNLRSLINLNVIELFPKSPELDKIEGEYLAKLAEKDEHIASLPSVEAHQAALAEIERLKALTSEAYEAALAEKDAEIERLRTAKPPPPVGDGDCFLMPSETGKGFHVIQGRQVTAEPISRAKAMAMMKELTAP